VEYTWDRFQSDIKKRFTDTREEVRAWRELRNMSYVDVFHSFLTKWDGLCAKAGVHGTVYRDMLLRAVGPAVRGKMENVAPANTDEGLREQVLNAGRIVELWADTRAHERDLGYRRPERTDHRTNRDHCTGNNTQPIPSATTSASTTATATAGSTWDRPAGTKTSVRPQQRQLYEQKFSTIEEAVNGVPQEVVQARRKEGLCLRCGYSKHTALHCHREPSSQMPRQIAAVEAEKHDREDSDDEEEMTKRPRMEVAAVDTQLPLYEDAGYESEDRWESDYWG
jgi:hypothetical protein